MICLTAVGFLQVIKFIALQKANSTLGRPGLSAEPFQLMLLACLLFNSSDAQSVRKQWLRPSGWPGWREKTRNERKGESEREGEGERESEMREMQKAASEPIWPLV